MTARLSENFAYGVYRSAKRADSCANGPANQGVALIATKPGRALKGGFPQEPSLLFFNNKPFYPRT